MNPAPERFPLLCLPTPCHALPRLSADLGIDLWIKRDDLTGFAMGGNKGRKLEYLIHDALKSGADIVTTCGSTQSNFVRQLAAACAVAGIRCAAALMDGPYEPGYQEPHPKPCRGGNLILDELFGLEIDHHPDGPWEELFARSTALAERHRRAGEQVYEIPIGGSSPLGAYGFVQAASEIPETFDFVVTATSSGSTHAGLAYGLAGAPTRVIGISCDPEPEIRDDLVRLSRGLDELLGSHRATADFDLRFDYVGPGYGWPSEAGEAAMTRMARQEGIVLDPVYSAKAFSGLIDLTKRGEISGRVLFWHTGGMPALFAHD